MFKKHQTKVIILIFFIISIFLTLFIHKDNNFSLIVDYPFHFNRILGIAENMKQGEILNTVDFNFLGGFGYLNPVFYNNLFLYPFALLKLIGMSNALILTILLFSIYFSTQSISFFASRSFFKNTRDSLIFSLSYSFSSYYLFDIVYRGAIGELFAIAMLPIPLFTFLNILYNKEYSKYWILSLGLLFVFINHNITTFLLILIFITFYLCNCFRNKEFKNITITYIKSGLLFITLSLFQIIPMMLTSQSQEFNVGVNVLFNLSDTKTLWQYTNFIETIIHSMLNNPLNTNLGSVGLLAIILGIIRFKKLNKLSKQLLVISVSIFLSMFILMDTGFLNNTIINIIQFSWRFYIVLIPLLSILYINILNSFENVKLKNYFKIGTISFYLLFILIFKIVQIDLIIPQFSNSQLIATYGIKNNKDYTYNIGSGREYLPSVMKPNFSEYEDLKLLSHDIQKENKDTELKNIEKQYSSIEFDIKTLKKDNIEIPFIYYKNFFKVTANDVEIPFSLSDSGMVKLKIDSNFEGHIIVAHKNPWYIYASWVLTITSTGCLIYIFYKKPQNLTT